MADMVSDAELTRALKDMMERVSRDDNDWGIYFEGDPRPQFPWWRRVLKLG